MAIFFPFFFTSLFTVVSNLATTVLEDDLHRIFSQLGHLTDIWVATDPENQPLGFAFCEYQEPEKAQIAASHLNNVSFKGTQIAVEPVPDARWKEERTRMRQVAEERAKAAAMPQRHVSLFVFAAQFIDQF